MFEELNLKTNLIYPANTVCSFLRALDFEEVYQLVYGNGRRLCNRGTTVNEILMKYALIKDFSLVMVQISTTYTVLLKAKKSEQISTVIK